jgi:hypothetical protein
MAKIIAVAENYAYGPVGKLLTVTKELLKQGHHITFIGEGTAYQLGSKEPFSKVVRMNYPALTGRGINVSYAAFQSNSVAV